MRSIWKGSLTFGLVNVPVSVYSATESHDVRLRQVHDADGGRIRYQRKCEVCEQVVPYENIDRAYTEGETTVVLTDEDFASLPAERTKEIEILEFVPSAQVDPIMFSNAYYLAPPGEMSKSYALLRRTLEETDRTAIVSFTLRQKTRLAALRVRGNVLMLQTLLWADEIREPDFAATTEEVKVSKKEMEMANQLVSSYESDFEPENYTDEYQKELRALIEAKMERGEAVETPEVAQEEGAEVVDLMEALRRSVAQSRKNKNSGAKDESSEAKSETA
ncbi:MAG TPA: Ku protein [Beutenbergiaceae bacterium]|nr:Ku protein [Beutenbergiaceae bacterium]